MIQLAALSGLRGLSEQVRMEMKTMGSMQLDTRDNVILREVWEEVMAEGLAAGEARGEAKGEVTGMMMALRSVLQTKFGRVPKWAEDRLKKAKRPQIERWLNKIVVAQTLEGASARSRIFIRCKPRSHRRDTQIPAANALAHNAGTPPH